MSKHKKNVNAEPVQPSVDELNQLELPLKKRRKLPEKKVIPDEQDLGFASKALVACSFPLSQPKNPDGSFVLYWERKNGTATQALTASPKYGLPSGRDRDFAEWLKKQSVMSGSPIVYFDTGASILKDMNLDPEGDNKIWLNEVIDRFSHTVMSYEEGDRKQGGSFEGSLIIKKMNGYFDKKNWNRKERSYFVLGDLFYQVPGIPIDQNTERKFGKAWFTKDLHKFINFRLWVITKHSTAEDDLTKWKPLRIPMREYREQCGLPINTPDKTVRFKIRTSLKQIKSKGSFKGSLDDNDVITVPIVKPKFVFRSEEERIEMDKAFEQLRSRQPLY